MKSSEIVAQVQANLNRSDATTVMVLQWLNNRKDQICNFDDFSFMEVTDESSIDTVADVSYVSLPARFKTELEIYLLSGTTKYILTKWVGNQAKAFTNLSHTGRPIAYYIWDDKVYFYPIPDATYDVGFKYYEYLVDFTDTDTVENHLGEYWPDLLINGATSDGFHYFHQSDKAAEWEIKWNTEFQKLLRKEGKRKYSNSLQRIKIILK